MQCNLRDDDDRRPVHRPGAWVHCGVVFKPQRPRGPVLSARLDARPTRTNEADLPLQIGRFFILRRLGSGGMSQVLLGYDEDLDRKLAIKLLRSRAGQYRDRMIREAQALAQLSHPNVVQIYEVGEVGESLYIAMEYVHGVTFDEWVYGRSVDEIVGVYLQAGRGLAAAHRAGLFHRDFKPQNAMVGRDDRVRVMDFGLVRGEATARVPEHTTLHAVDSALWTEMTQEGMTAGTPAYMAPEQWSGAPIDGRTDQFSLCVALWEALYGERPFSGRKVDALREQVLHGDRSPPPSDRPVPTWLRKVLERGLATDPDHRWPTMDALLAALAGGAARRRRFALASAGLALVTVAAAAVGVERWSDASFTADCEAIGHGVATLWNDDVQQRLRTTFTAADPGGAQTFARLAPFADRYTTLWQAARTDLCMRSRDDERWTPTLVARGEECLLESRLRLESSLVVLQRADAAGVRGAVEMVAELPPVDPCLDLAHLARRPPLPDELAADTTVLALRRDLADIQARHAAGNYRDALVRGQALLPAIDALGWPPLATQARLVVAHAAAATEDLELAESLLTDSLVAAASTGDEAAAADATALLAEVVGTRLARHDEGLRWGRLAIALVAAQGDTDSARGARVLHTLADNYFDLGDYVESERLHNRALTIRLTQLGPDHPDVARSQVRLGDIRHLRNQPAAAAAIYEQALALRQRVLGPDHPEVAAILNSLAQLQRSRGDLDAAQQLHEQALEIRERTLGPDHPEVARSLSDLAAVATERTQFTTAERLLERSLKILGRVHGPSHPGLAGPQLRLADLYRRSGEHDKALPAYTRALALTEAAHGPDHIDNAWPLFGLGQEELARGRLATATVCLERAMKLFERSGLTLEAARVRAALARTLWPRRSTRPHAHDLAEQASVVLCAGGPRERCDEVKTWLATHELAPIRAARRSRGRA